MKKFIKNYKSSLILIMSIIIGTIVGLIFKDKATILSPLGDIFLNLLLIIIVPLIFLTLSTSIGKMKQPKRIGKILTTIILVFAFTSIVSVFVGIVSTKAFRLVDVKDEAAIKEVLNGAEEITNEDVNFLERTVEAVSVNDFSNVSFNFLNDINFIFKRRCFDYPRRRARKDYIIMVAGDMNNKIFSIIINPKT